MRRISELKARVVTSIIVQELTEFVDPCNKFRMQKLHLIQVGTAHVMVVQRNEVELNRSTCEYGWL